MSEKIVHQGKAVKRIREILGIKQDQLAVDLGITQQAVSLLEGKEIIDSKMLEDVAKVLHVTADAIKNYDEDAAINIISNTFTDFKDNASAINSNCHLTFNPVDKVIELYERMLKEKDEIIAQLQQDKK
jgi:transcriptional regulator with XRE-family HTH domain